MYRKRLAIHIALAVISCCLPILSHAGDVNSNLREAAKKGKLKKVSQLLASGANVDSHDEISRTALMFAAENGNVHIVELLLGSGADISCRDILGESALDKARMKKQTEVLAMLELAEAWGHAFQFKDGENRIDKFKSFLKHYDLSSNIAVIPSLLDSLYWQVAVEAHTPLSYWIYLQTPGVRRFSDRAYSEFNQMLLSLQHMEIYLLETVGMCQ